MKFLTYDDNYEDRVLIIMATIYSNLRIIEREFEIPRSTMEKVLNKAKFHPCYLKLTHALSQEDMQLDKSVCIFWRGNFTQIGPFVTLRRHNDLCSIWPGSSTHRLVNVWSMFKASVPVTVVKMEKEEFCALMKHLYSEK